jgi:hypothetical protein
MDFIKQVCVEFVFEHVQIKGRAVGAEKPPGPKKKKKVDCWGHSSRGKVHDIVETK